MREFKLQDDKATIGFIREDGDLEVLAAFNNSGSHLTAEHFASIVEETTYCFRWSCEGYEIKAYYRHDLEDTVDLGEEHVSGAY